MFVQIFQAVHLDINIHKPIISEYIRIMSYGCFLKWGYPISSSNLMGLSTINQPFGGSSMCGIPFIVVIPPWKNTFWSGLHGLGIFWESPTSRRSLTYFEKVLGDKPQSLPSCDEMFSNRRVVLQLSHVASVQSRKRRSSSVDDSTWGISARWAVWLYVLAKYGGEGPPVFTNIDHTSTSLPLVDGFHGFQDSCSMELSLRIQGCSVRFEVVVRLPHLLNASWYS